MLAHKDVTILIELVKDEIKAVETRAPQNKAMIIFLYELKTKLNQMKELN